MGKKLQFAIVLAAGSLLVAFIATVFVGAMYVVYHAAIGRRTCLPLAAVIIVTSLMMNRYSPDRKG